MSAKIPPEIPSKIPSVILPVIPIGISSDISPVIHSEIPPGFFFFFRDPFQDSSGIPPWILSGSFFQEFLSENPSTFPPGITVGIPSWIPPEIRFLQTILPVCFQVILPEFLENSVRSSFKNSVRVVPGFSSDFFRYVSKTSMQSYFCQYLHPEFLPEFRSDFL